MSYFRTLAEASGLGEEDLLRFIKTAPHRYKKFSIPKRNGKGLRLIAQPSQELKQLQQLGSTLILSGLATHDAAYAYQAGRSIKDNALQHVKKQYLLKMDFKDFFPSIKPPLLLNIINTKQQVLAEQDQYLVERLFFWKSTRIAPLELCIGAPSSPLISNVVMHDFDRFMHKFCTNADISYTRYADDLTFSTNQKNVLFRIPNVVNDYLANNESLGLQLNQDKTTFSSKKHNRHVTGIVLNNEGNLSLGRGRKREIKTLVYLFTKQRLSNEQANRLKGLVAFVQQIEPKFYYSLQSKYGSETIRMIQRFVAC